MNSRLFNIPAILVTILTVSISAYIYNSAQSTITDAMDALSTQEVEAFNSLFAMYEGHQTGSNVKALMGKLISNANTNVDNSEKVPYVYIDQLNETSKETIEVEFKQRDEGDSTEYINELNQIRNQINTKHEYYVEMSYQSNGLIDYIIISFDPQNIINDIKHRNQKTNLFDTNSLDDDINNNLDSNVETTISTQEREAFNNQFLSYEGRQTGSNVKALMGRLIANGDTYRDEPNKVPYIYIDRLSNNQLESSEAIYESEADFNDYINTLGKIRNRVESKHEYNIKITYQADTGIIDYIQIYYDIENDIQEEKHR